jgi:hypothetical protein
VRTSLAFFSPIPGTGLYDEAVGHSNLPSDADPILTNNAVFPVLSGLLPLETCFKLSTLAATANFEVANGREPIEDDRVLGLMEQLSKRH